MTDLVAVPTTAPDSDSIKVALQATYGWYADSGADWSSSFEHIKIPAFLLSLYQLYPNKFITAELNAPETFSSFPAIVEEGAFYLRFLYRLRHELLLRFSGKRGVGSQVFPIGNPVEGQPSWKDTRDWYISGEDPFSTYMYAGGAGQMVAIQYHLGEKLVEEGKAVVPAKDSAGVQWSTEATEAWEWAEEQVHNEDKTLKTEMLNKVIDGLPLWAYRAYAAVGIYSNPALSVADAALYKKAINDYIEKTDYLGSTTSLADDPEDLRIVLGALILDLPAEKLNALNAAAVQKLKVAFDSATDDFSGELANHADQWTGIPGDSVGLGAASTPKLSAAIFGYKSIAATNSAKAANILSFCQTTADYFLGGNPLNTTWITGGGPRFPRDSYCLDDWYSTPTSSPPPPSNYSSPLAHRGIVPFGPVDKPGSTSSLVDSGLINRVWASAYPSSDKWPKHEAWFDCGISEDLAGYSITKTNLMAALTYGFLSDESIQFALASSKVFFVDPISQHIAPGRGVDLYALADPISGGAYQWLKDGKVIPGAINPVLRIFPMRDADAGSYYCLTSGVFGTTGSASAVLSLSTVPIITVQPTNQYIVAGGSATFQARAGSVNYKWQISKDGGKTWADLANGGVYSGVKTDKLSITGATNDISQNQYRYLASSNSGFDSATTTNSSPFSIYVALVHFPRPAGIMRDTNNSIYVVDKKSNNVQRVDASGVPTMIAGPDVTSGDNIPQGSADGDGPAATFNEPQGVAVAYDGTFRTTAPTTIPVTLPTTVSSTYPTTGPSGQATTAPTTIPTTYPTHIPSFYTIPAADDTVYVTDTGNSIIRKIVRKLDANNKPVTNSSGSPVFTVSTIAGSASASGMQDGIGAAARFSKPTAVVVNRSQKNILYVADTGNNSIRKVEIKNDGAHVSTLVGTASGILFSGPSGLAVTMDGKTMYVADTGNSRICKIDLASINADGFAGTAGVSGYADGPVATATFNLPQGLTLDNSEQNLIVADTGNSTIRSISLSRNVVSTLAGVPMVADMADGSGLEALFKLPQGVTTGATGTIVISDTGNSLIRLLDPSGYVVTLPVATAPVFTTQPLSQTVPENSNAVFTVVTSATPAASYSWELFDVQKNAWSPVQDTPYAIYGGTTATLTIPRVSLKSSGIRFRCAAYNSAGEALSNEVTLTVGGSGTTPTTTTAPTSTPSSGGGGGAPSGLFLAGLAVVSLVRSLIRRR
jgi:sugar lactone lactonase YvrE